MKNMGVFDPNWYPVKAGGLTQHEIDYLKRQGSLEGVTDHNVQDVLIRFSAPHLPGGFTMHNFSVPAGTKYLYRDSLIRTGRPNGGCRWT